METIIIRDTESQPIKLSPLPIVPGASFTVSNNTGLNIRVTVNSRIITLEAIDS